MTYLIALAMTLGPLVTLFNEATRLGRAPASKMGGRRVCIYVREKLWSD